MTAAPAKKFDWIIASFVFYGVTFLILLILSLIFGGPIIAGFCPWAAIGTIHWFAVICIDKRPRGH